MIITNSKDSGIIDMDSWHEAFLEVDQARHWKEGRSAYLLAKLFTTPTIENSNGLTALKEVLNLFGCRVKEFSKGVIEKEVRIDEFPNGRVNDLCLWGVEESGKKICTYIEAKVDETFGSTIVQTIKRGMDRSSESHLYARAMGMMTVLNLKYEEVMHMKYQLLAYLTSGIVGSSNAEVIFLPIIAFKTKFCNRFRLQLNENDYTMFMDAVGFSRCDEDDIIMYRGKLGDILVFSAYIIVEDDSEENGSLSEDEKFNIREKYPDGILNAFLSLDPSTMSPMEVYERFSEIKRDYNKVVLGLE